MAPAALLQFSDAEDFADDIILESDERGPILRRPSNSRYGPRRNIYLPPELVLQILAFIPIRNSSQDIFYSCCLVSRTWYTATVPFLYDSPHITGRNFSKFITTVCPSINAHVRKSELADLVRKLDMGQLVHNGSKSLTARLLGRVKVRLEEFIAPQASFAINCFAALSKCSRLRYLDLSLISQSISLHDLFHALKPLSNLEILWFPRCANHDRGYDAHNTEWPPKLHTLHLTGGVSNHFLQYLTNAPPNLRRLTIENCRTSGAGNILAMLETLGPQLTHLHINHNIPCLWYQSLDRVLLLCPNLILLRIPMDYISSMFFDPINAPPGPPHPLETLELDSSGDHGVETNFVPDDIFLAVDEGPLRNLRRVLLGTRVGWKAHAGFVSDLADLAVLLEERAEQRIKARIEEEERKNAARILEDYHLSARQYGQYGQNSRFGPFSQFNQFGPYGFHTSGAPASNPFPHHPHPISFDWHSQVPEQEKKEEAETTTTQDPKDTKEKVGIFSTHLELRGINDDNEETTSKVQ